MDIGKALEVVQSLDANEVGGLGKKEFKKDGSCTCPGGPAAARRRPERVGPAFKIVFFGRAGGRVTLCFAL